MVKLTELDDLAADHAAVNPPDLPADHAAVNQPDLPADHPNHLAVVHYRRLLCVNDLPDSVLEQVLSYLDITEAVLSSLLSRRWRIIWHGIPRLNLFLDSAKRKYIERIKSLMRKVLELHSPGPGRFSSFRVNFVNPISCVAISISLRDWIFFAIDRRVQELHLQAPLLLSSPLSVIFRSQYLVRIHLEFRGPFENNIEIFIPNCITMVLKHLLFQDDGFMLRILAGCPRIQNLIVHTDLVSLYSSNRERDSYVLQIASTSLIHLELQLTDSREREKLIRCIIVINSTSLQEIVVNSSTDSDLFIASRMLFNFTSTIPQFYIYSERSTWLSGHTFGSPLALTLFDVHSLVLSPLVIENLGYIGDTSLGRFLKLKKLVLNVRIWDIPTVLLILQHVPVLEIFCMGMDEHCVQNSGYEAHYEGPTCVRESLRHVTITGYDGSPQILGFVAMLLRDGGALEKVTIRVCDRELVFHEEILRRQQPSPSSVSIRIYC